MMNTYSTAKIFSFKTSTDCDLLLEPNLINTMATSRDPKELKFVWLEWRHNNLTDGIDLYLK